MDISEDFATIFQRVTAFANRNFIPQYMNLFHKWEQVISFKSSPPMRMEIIFFVKDIFL